MVETVSRLFHLFLPGRPGVGLLLLRNSVAALFIVDVNAHYPLKLSGWIALGLLVLALHLCLGFLTFLFSLFCSLFEVAVLLIWNDHTQASVLLAVLALSLALLGPGGYSLDAKFFSRRVIVFPDAERTGGRRKPHLSIEE
jgi:hypothetical protein